MENLELGVRFRYHNDRRLFRSATSKSAFPGLGGSTTNGPSRNNATTTVQPWGQWSWSLVLSAPERAILELLDELPLRETFHQADQLFGGMANLSPRRLQALLADCRSVKVKCPFFYFADRHRHAWLKRIDKDEITLGTGKRMLVRGGKLDPTYQITVPGELDGVR